MSMLGSILDHTHTHTVYSHIRAHVAMPLITTRGPSGATKQEGQRAGENNNNKKKNLNTPFWQVQTTVKGNTDPFVCHLWCQEASPMYLNSMLCCSIDSSTAVLPPAAVSLSKTNSEGLFVHTAACYSLNDGMLICAGFTLSSHGCRGRGNVLTLGNALNSHAGI